MEAVQQEEVDSVDSASDEMNPKIYVSKSWEARYKQQPSRVLRIGDCIRGRDIGTLGCFATRIQDGKLVVLSAGHVLGKPRRDICQRKTLDYSEDKQVVGFVDMCCMRETADTKFRMNDYGTALVLEENSPNTNNDIGTDVDWEAVGMKNVQLNFTANDLQFSKSPTRTVEFTDSRVRCEGFPIVGDPRKVLKMGAATRLTKGHVTGMWHYLGPNQRKYVVLSSEATGIFSRSGDCGSIVFDAISGCALGMITSGIETAIDHTFITPMAQILTDLQIQILEPCEENKQNKEACLPIRQN